MAMILTISGLIMVLCILCNRISTKLGVPALLIFIVLGMIFGVDGIFKIPFEDYAFTEQICTVALIFIMFYGGFGTNWKVAKPVAVKAISLSTLGVIATAGLVGLFCHYVLDFGWLTGMLVGATISSTDAASVFSILRSRKLDLKEGTASLLEVESGSNDPCSYMLTMIILTLIQGDGSQSIGYMVFAQLIYGGLFGVLIALGAVWVLKRVRFGTEGFDGIFVFAVAILAYAMPSVVGGNGYLSVYIAGIIMGNQKINNKTTLVHFFDSLTVLAQMMIFFLLGLLSYPTRMLGILGTSLAIALFLTFVARPAAVFFILTPLRCSWRQQLLVSWSGLRGAASIVFAIMVVISGASPEGRLFDIVFGVVLFSIAFQGTLLPFFARKLNMVDEDGDIFKTFNDYTEDTEVQFIKIAVTEGHNWANQEVKDLILPPDTLLAMIYRGEETVIPGGSTMLLPGDVAVLAAPAFRDSHHVRLCEVKITGEHEWKGKQISQLDLPLGSLIIMIKRPNGHTVVPKGSTEIQKDDVLVLNGFCI